jgi:hypothetical protein
MHKHVQQSVGLQMRVWTHQSNRERFGTGDERSKKTQPNTQNGLSGSGGGMSKDLNAMIVITKPFCDFDKWKESFESIL